MIIAFRTTIIFLFSIVTLAWLISCTPPPPLLEPEPPVVITLVDTVIVEKEIPVVEIDPIVHTSNNFDEISFILPAEINAQHLWFIEESLREISAGSVKHILADSVRDDSLSVLIAQTIFNDFSADVPNYKFLSATSSGDSLFIHYKLNKMFIDHLIKPYLDTYGFPALKSIAPLYTSHHNPPALEAVSELKLTLPCEACAVPKQALLLPNAPRDYRNGTHRGIDFYVNWGSPVRAVADGVVIRADQHYEEVPSEFRKKLLAEAKQLGHTPSDVFEHILVGQSVYIDHGFDLVSGYRTVSIYAHLSHVKPEIKPGELVATGQVMGLSGNSGTEPSTLGTRKGAHLHWELILQDAGGEYYLGQGWDTEKLYQELIRIFSE